MKPNPDKDRGIVCLVYVRKGRGKKTWRDYKSWLYFGTVRDAVKNSLFENDEKFEPVVDMFMPIWQFIWTVIIDRNGRYWHWRKVK